MWAVGAEIGTANPSDHWTTRHADLALEDRPEALSAGGGRFAGESNGLPLIANGGGRPERVSNPLHV